VIGKRTRKVLDQFAEATRNKASQNLGTRTIGKNRSYGATKSRSLAKSLYANVQSNGSIEFGSTKFYAPFIHEGVSGTKVKRKTPFSYKKKQPPVGSIMNWLRLKPVRLRNAEGQFIKQTPSRLKSAAFNIARSIKEKGIPGLAYYTEAWEMTLPRWEGKIAQAQADDILDKLDKDIEKLNRKQ
jgi:hypothetical protein